MTCDGKATLLFLEMSLALHMKCSCTVIHWRMSWVSWRRSIVDLQGGGTEMHSAGQGVCVCETLGVTGNLLV